MYKEILYISKEIHHFKQRHQINKKLQEENGKINKASNNKHPNK